MARTNCRYPQSWNTTLDQPQVNFSALQIPASAMYGRAADIAQRLTLTNPAMSVGAAYATLLASAAQNVTAHNGDRPESTGLYVGVMCFGLWDAGSVHQAALAVEATVADSASDLGDYTNFTGAPVTQDSLVKSLRTRSKRTTGRFKALWLPGMLRPDLMLRRTNTVLFQLSSAFTHNGTLKSDRLGNVNCDLSLVSTLDCCGAPWEGDYTRLIAPLKSRLILIPPHPYCYGPYVAADRADLPSNKWASRNHLDPAAKDRFRDSRMSGDVDVAGVFQRTHRWQRDQKAAWQGAHLDLIAMRIAAVSAALNGEPAVAPACLKAALRFTRWQLHLRRYFDGYTCDPE